METIVNTLPGYRVFEYALVLNPHEELWNRIMKVKEDFSVAYKTESGRWGKPHVKLATFTQYAMIESRIIHKIRTVAMSYPPFKVELKNYGSFPAHSIYINMTSKLPVQNLVRSIRSESQQLMKLDAEHKPHFMMEPHITVAAKLKPWQYEKGWLEYSNRHFTGRFIADGMTLLKRPAGEGKYYVAEQFEFQNLPVLTRQGDLFG